MNNLKICETLTKLDVKGIKKAFKEFADFDIDARNEIFKILQRQGNGKSFRFGFRDK